jgi:hypothetical protein
MFLQLTTEPETELPRVQMEQCTRKTNHNVRTRISMITNWSVNKGVALPSQQARAAEDGVTSLLPGSVINILKQSSSSDCRPTVKVSVLTKEDQRDVANRRHQYVTDST